LGKEEGQVKRRWVHTHKGGGGGGGGGEKKRVEQRGIGSKKRNEKRGRGKDEEKYIFGCIKKIYKT